MLNIMGNIPEYSRNIDVFWFADGYIMTQEQD